MTTTPTLRYTGRWYVQHIYKDIIHDPRLSVGAKATYVALMGFVSESSPKPFPSQDHLARILDSNPRTIIRYIKELEKHGLLEKEQLHRNGRFHSNSYTLYDSFGDSREAIRDGGAIRNTDVIKTAVSKTAVSKTAVSKCAHKGIATGKGNATGEKERTTTITGPASGGGADGGAPTGKGAPPPVTPASPNPEPEKKSEAREDAENLAKGWRNLVRKLKGFKVQTGEPTIQLMEQWFEKHPNWNFLDVLWVAFQAILKAEKFPRPSSGFDPFIYSRMAHTLRWFNPNKDGTCKIEATTTEVGYHLELSDEQISERIEKCLANMACS